LEAKLSEDRPPGKPRAPDDEEREGAAEGGAELGADPSATLGEVLEAPPGSGPAEAFHQRARLAEDRLAEVLAAYRKLKAETEAHRERTTRNLERKYQQRHEALLLGFMQILDNLDRALEAAETSYGGQPLIEGLILVRTQLVQMLQEEGLERIPVLGLPYDPHVSEVVATVPVKDPDQHHVVMKEMLRGYRISGRVARASQVVVGEYDAAEAEAPVKAEAEVTPTSKTQAMPTIAALPVEAPPAAPPAAETIVADDESLEDILARAERAVEAGPKPPDEDS
jgi:molecular chaperone GrpE